MLFGDNSEVCSKTAFLAPRAKKSKTEKKSGPKLEFLARKTDSPRFDGPRTKTHPKICLGGVLGQKGFLKHFEN